MWEVILANENMIGDGRYASLADQVSTSNKQAGRWAHANQSINMKERAPLAFLEPVEAIVKRRDVRLC